MTSTLADAAKAAATGTPSTELQKAPEKAVAIRRIEAAKAGIQSAIPASLSIDADRFIRIMATEIQRLPELNECTRESFLGAVLECAALGLEPGALQQAVILPFSNSKKINGEWVKVKEAQLIIEYRGFIELGYRSGILKDVTLGVVHVGDVWKHYIDKTGEYLYHEPLEDETPVIAYYGVFTLTNGGSVVQTLTPKQVESRRKKSSAQRVWVGKKMVPSETPIGSWLEHYEAFALKTIVRAAENRIPKSAETARAFAADGRVILNTAPESTATADRNILDVESFDENAEDATAPVAATSTPAAEPAAQASAPASTPAGDVDPAQMDLRTVTAALEAAGLSVGGNLAAKRARLAEHRAANAPAAETPIAAESDDDDIAEGEVVEEETGLIVDEETLGAARQIVDPMADEDVTAVLGDMGINASGDLDLNRDRLVQALAARAAEKAMDQA